MFQFKTVLAGAVLVPLIAAHGGGMNYTIDGLRHEGNYKILNNTHSIQRSWIWDYDVEVLDDQYHACGYTGQPSINSYHAPLQAGHIVNVDYSLYGSSWTFLHPYGPMLAYMASCPDDGCESVDVNAPIWFKIWEAGLLEGTWLNGHWALRDVFEGATLDIQTPASLKPGKYLLRHEMVNLQTGPVQFFPNCIQLDVSGTGSNFPRPEELVSFPGAYDKDEDKSFVVNKGSGWFYSTHKDDTVYPMPGPAVWEG